MSSPFDQKSSSWDTPEKILQAKNLAQKIQSHLGNTPFTRIMEIGCGTGLLGTLFLGPESKYLGLDGSEGMLRVLEEKAIPGVATRLIDLDHTPLPEGPWSLVISSMAFHHLIDPGRMLKHLDLAPNGNLVVVDLNQEDGTFHPDPKAMGVHHFGFSRETVASWAMNGLALQHWDVAQHIEKNGRSYSQFLAIFQKK